MVNPQLTRLPHLLTFVFTPIKYHGQLPASTVSWG